MHTPEELALALATSHQGNTSPNPPVGAVIVQNGIVVAEGATEPAGGKHAEIVALESCIETVVGADLYVTLEPCCHYGKTGPCTDRIIDSGIGRVFIGYTDPNPLISGKGIRALQAAGIEVKQWEDSTLCSVLYEAFEKYITTNQAFVTAKFAISLDGKICTHTGDSKWISNQASRNIVHDFRRKSDAILTGIGTVLADNPSLTARNSDDSPWADRQPTRVIADSNFRLKTALDLNIFKQPGKTIIATTSELGNTILPETVSVHTFPPNSTGKVDLTSLLKTLTELGLINIFVESGNNLLGELFDKNLIDKVLAFVAPIIIGGSEAKSPIGGNGRKTIEEALRITRTTVSDVDGDILVTGYIN